MTLRRFLGIGLVILLLVVAGFGGWLVTLPAAVAAPTPAALSQDETAALVAALKPPKRARPLIAVIGANAGTETTDYLMPTGILRRADVADVVLVSTEEGPMQLYPVFQVEADATTASFDTQHPDGADYVIVPAMTREDDPDVLAWVKAQSAKGATIIGVCVGSKVVGNTGLLDGKRATTHWYSRDSLVDEHPGITYVPDRRIVADGNVITTTGISASMPLSLTLIEAIAGREKAAEVAQSLGIEHWDARHASEAFAFSRPFATTVLANSVAFWTHEDWGLALKPDLDEVTLALVADAWSRTYRSQAVTFAESATPITTANGVRIIPDDVVTRWPAPQVLPAMDDLPPAQALNESLEGIAARYGARTADLVAMQLEYAPPTP